MRYIVFSLIIMLQPGTFKDAQLKNSRVKTAYDEKENTIKDLFKQKGLNYSGFHMFIRAFKLERKLEVWVKEKNKETYSLLHTYDFCTSSGRLGPKRREGDLQIPEGVYHINHFNPFSNYHLSLGVSYPNASDKILSDPKHPGGAIYVHGSCASIGCIPITDEKIKEVYVMAVEARDHGQEKIPIHIYPCRMDINGQDILKKETGDIGTLKFWDNLRPVYQDFESSRKLKSITVDNKGLYHLK